MGGENSTAADFIANSEIEISGNGFDEGYTSIFFAVSDGKNGELTINGIFDNEFTTINLEILSDTNITASTSGDFG